MDKISKIWCFGLLAITFIIYNGVTVRFVYPKIFFMQAWLSLGLLFFAFKVAQKRTLEMGTLTLSLFALLLVSFISLIYTPDLTVALFGPFWRGTGLVFYASTFISFLLLKELYEGDKKTFALGIIYTGYLIVTVIFISFLFTFKVNKSIYYVIGNVNPLSFWLGITLLLSYLYREEFNDKKWLLYVFGLILLVMLVLLGSRSATGGLLICAFLIGLSKGKKVLKASLGLFLLTIGGLLLQYFLFKSSVLADIIVRTKNFGRLGIWQGAFDSFLDKPIGGYGFHGLILGYWENYTSYLSKGHAWNENAHSLFLNIAGELGVVGLIALCAVIYFVIVQIKKSSNRVVWGAIGLYCLIYCLTQPFFVDTVFLILFLIFLLGEESKFTVPSENIVYRVSKTLVACLLLFITYQQFSQIGLLNETRRQIAKHGNYRKVWKSLAEGPSYIDKVGAFFEINTLLINSFAHAKIGESEMDKEIRNRSKRFIKEGLDSLMKENNHRPKLLRTYALTLIQQNDLEKADRVLDMVLEKSDQVTEMYYYKAVIYAKQRKNSEAKKMLLKVKELNPDYVGIDAQLEKLKNY